MYLYFYAKIIKKYISLYNVKGKIVPKRLFSIAHVPDDDIRFCLAETKTFYMYKKAGETFVSPAPGSDFYQPARYNTLTIT